MTGCLVFVVGLILLGTPYWSLGVVLLVVSLDIEGPLLDMKTKDGGRVTIGKRPEE